MIDVVALASFLETKLNDNTQGLVFRTYTFEQHLDKRYDTVNGVKVSFVPSIITTPTGSYLPINDVQGARLQFNLEIMLPLKYKDNWINMLNNFVWSINGKYFYIDPTDGSYDTTYASGKTTAKITCQVPTFGTVNPQNFETIRDISSYLPINETESYIAINIPISLKTVIGFNVGDEAKASIAVYANETPATHTYYKLKVTDLTIKNSKVPQTSHVDGETTGKTRIIQNDVKYIMTCYYEKTTILDNLMNDIALGTNMNRLYWLKLEIPSGTQYVKVVLFDNNAIYPIDDFTVIPLVFAKAWVD